MLRWLWVTVAVVALDQASKAHVSNSFSLYESLPLLPGLNITLLHNTGAAFSFLSDAGGWQRWFFVAVALIMCAVIVFWLRGLERGQRWQAAALALVLGGAIGNVWDRMTLGYVVDFIDVHYAGWHWPAFNVADSAITVGAVILIIDALHEGFGRKPKASA